MRFYRLTMALVLVAFVALVAYWLVWFFVDREALASADTVAYYAFEERVPRAPTRGSRPRAPRPRYTLHRRRPAALFWLLAGGSSAIYLGLLDVLFDLENGVYLAPKGDWGAVATELSINVYSLGVGVWALSFGWVNRRQLLGVGPKPEARSPKPGQ